MEECTKCGRLFNDLDYDVGFECGINKCPQKSSGGGDFIVSGIIGAVTGSALLGGLIGGDFIGGAVGDLLDGDLLD